MGQYCSCFHDVEGPYDLSVRVVDATNFDAAWTDVKAEITVAGRSETTPVGTHRGTRFVWNHPPPGAPWVFHGTDFQRDTLAVKLVGISKESGPMPLPTLRLSRGEIVKTNLQIDDHIITVEIKLQETKPPPCGKPDAAKHPADTGAKDGLKDGRPSSAPAPPPAPAPGETPGKPEPS